MERCGFFDASLVGEKYDRVYLASSFAAYFSSFIGNGVFAKKSDKLQVVSMATPSMQVSVLPGQGWINGYWYENEDDLYLPIDVADGVLNRIDSVVLRFGSAERSVWLAIKKGTPAITPASPQVTRNADYYELQIATINIAAGSINITQAKITDTRMDANVCGWVTGIVDQIDTTTLFAQFETYFQEFKDTYALEYNTWTTQQKSAYITWFDTMKGQLTTDAAGHLQTEIDTINAQTIGGANLLTGSKDFSGAWVNSDKWTTEVSKYRGFTVKKSTINYGGLSQSFSVPNNANLVYSFYAKTDNPSAIHAVYCADDAHVDEFDKVYVIVPLTTEWKRYEVTFTSKVDNAHASIRLNLATGSSTTYICAPCLQYGDKATEWAPNELDAITDLRNETTGVAHNSIYRGKNLGTSVTAAQYTAISAGTFDDLYIGDYWTIGGVNYRIAALDYYWNCGDSATPPHHAVIVPEKNLYNAKINTTDTTTGGYVGSQMYTANLEQAKTTIKAAFSGHVMKHRIYLVNAVTNGYSSGGAWYDSEVDLMNEQMVYGSGIFSPVSTGGVVPANYRVEKNQLPLFAMNPAMLNTREKYWLRDVITASYFAFVPDSGFAAYSSASSSLGVRPAFCIG